MILLRGITKYFGKNCAIKNINLDIEQGDLFALLGPNGAGKSTILGIMNGLINPSSGTVIINDKRLSTNRKEISHNMGVLFENPTFYDYLSGKENLTILAKIKGHYDKKEISDLLETASLSEKSGVPVKKYSLGMKQRLALAAALINDPEILILDEPTNGLDPEGIHIILSILKNFSTQRKKTIIISSHQVYDVESLCNKIAIIKEGRIICKGKLDELLKEDTKSYLITVDETEEYKQFLTQPWIKNFKVIHRRKNLKDFYIETIKKTNEELS